MSKKWYNFFVSVERPPEGGSEEAGEGKQAGSTAAQTVAEIAASVAAEPKFAAPVTNPTSFDEIYQAAEIQLPAHGYSILKIADMLQSEHIREMPVEVKRSSILLALEAAGIKIAEVIEDAVRRDRALDGYERVLQKSLEELEKRKMEENDRTQAELEKLVAEHRARIQANNDEVARERDRFYGWRLQKQQEEKRIADAVSYFVSENPISTAGSGTAPSPAKKD